MTIVETTAGRVRGRTRDGVSEFRGIPYGEPTAGAGRFLPPRAVTPWSGVRDALEYGPMAEQPLMSAVPLPPGRRMGEDCLVVNVWTPAPDDARRPVIVSIHGGGFAIGAGDLAGEHLARGHDVVVVSLNHRLNAFGHLYLAGIAGAAYTESGNVGLLDIVSALTWIHDNVVAFGGDPDNLTLIGGSGGGWKISALLAMPAARGLFHKAILQSGSMIRARTAEAADAGARRLLSDLGIPPERWDRLREVPAAAIVEATMRRHSSESQAGVMTPAVIEADGTLTWDGDVGWPVVDGLSLPRDPFVPDATDLAAGIPMIVGTNRDEFVGLPTWISHVGDGATETVETVGLPRMLERTGLSPAQARRLAEAYAAASPAASPSELLDGIIGDANFLVPSVILTEAKARQNDGAVYSYLFSWEWNGVAQHGLDGAFCLGDVEPLLGSDRDESTRRLARRMSAAWATFARTGDPNHPDLPAWPPYTVPERLTMVFDHECVVSSDPRRAQREALAAARSEP